MFGSSFFRRWATIGSSIALVSAFGITRAPWATAQPPLGGEVELSEDGTGTVAGDRLRGLAALERALGKDAYYRSLSAENLQQAIDQLLDNRRERISSYYRMRALRDRKVDRNDADVTHSEALRRARQKAPDRLTKRHFYDKTGTLFWPQPLGAEVLKPYTTPIDKKFQKRASDAEAYGPEDADVVQRMVGLIQDALETLEDDMTPEDYVRVTQYLDRVAYEARFNGKGERVDLNYALPRPGASQGSQTQGSGSQGSNPQGNQSQGNQSAEAPAAPSGQADGGSS